MVNTKNTSPIRRQELVFVEFYDRKPGMPSKRAKPIALPDDEVPARIWTLYKELDSDKRPKLPYHPVHNHNAFAEDYVHDWDVRDRKLHYYSRITETPMWLLLEYR